MGRIDSFSGPNRFLSNFWPCAILLEEDGLIYPSVEHAYQASKTTWADHRALIRNNPSPGAAKHRGRLFALRPGWEEMKTEVMYQLLEKKFAHYDLRRLLLATRPHELVEGNTWGDTFWGVCRGEGQNWLGRLLMYVRDGYFTGGT